MENMYRDESLHRSRVRGIVNEKGLSKDRRCGKGDLQSWGQGGLYENSPEPFSSLYTPQLPANSVAVLYESSRSTVAGAKSGVTITTSVVVSSVKCEPQVSVRYHPSELTFTTIYEDFEWGHQ